MIPYSFKGWCGVILVITGGERQNLSMINISASYSWFWMKNEGSIKTDSVSLASEATFILVLQALTVINQTRSFISSFPYTLIGFG